MENHHLIFMLDKLLPGSMGGFDYEVITQYAPDGVTIEVEAQIHAWKLDTVPQPTQETLVSLWESTYDAAYIADMAEQTAVEEARIQGIVDNSLL